MNNDFYGFRGNVKYLVSMYEKNIPRVCTFIADKDFIDDESLLKALISGLKEEEAVIKEEYKKPYVTDHYENGVRNFTNALCKLLISKYVMLKKYDLFEELLRQKHVGHSFYHIDCEADTKLSELEEKFEEKHRKAAYLGLIEFYHAFYGSFSDNEEAIVLLCKYYPSVLLSEAENEMLVEALAKHIKNAGTVNDIGYAYHGIEKIEAYIKYIPERLIAMLVHQYELVRVLNNKVSRHQLYSIVNASVLDDEQKRKLKFRCIDSLWIANYFDWYLVRRMQENGEEVQVYYSNIDTKVGDEVLPVLDKPEGYWKSTEWDARAFFLDGKPYIGISLQGERIVVRSYKKGVESLEMPYRYDDWQMELRYRPETLEWLNNMDAMEESVENKQMVFSLLYLDNYRGMQRQIFEFDHKTKYEIDTQKLSLREETGPSMHFYGKNVYSLSCIVGRNGAGKTSVVDFLRETFFGLLKIIENNGRSCENGYIEEWFYEKSGILEKGARFLIVYFLGEKPYYLTNIKGVTGEGITPLKGGNQKMNEAEFSKVVYFSNMLKTNQKELFAEEEQEKEKEKDEKENKEKLIKDSTRNFRQIDFSETKSFIIKQRAIEVMREQQKNRELYDTHAGKEDREHANKELCYQLAFLSQVSAGEIKKYLNFEPTKELIFSDLYQKEEHTGDIIPEEEMISLQEMWENSSELIRLVKACKEKPDVGLKYFSSGEHAKLAFLAKLYWMLSEVKGKGEFLCNLLNNYTFDRSEFLQADETALIFIDEGEVYYHPEWQRSYLSDLLTIIGSAANIKVQIVLTTNSPFIISDVLKEDVVYLIKDGAKKDDREGTLGQNIHHLLKNNFFMNSTIGEYAKQFIQDIQMLLTDESQQNAGEANQEERAMQERVKQEICRKYLGKKEATLEEIQSMIAMIGEPVYRHGLEKMLEDSSYMKEDEILKLEYERQLIEKKIASLKGATDDKN